MNVLIVSVGKSEHADLLEHCLCTMGKGVLWVSNADEAVASVHTGKPEPQVVAIFSEGVDVSSVVLGVHELDIYLPVVVFAWPWEKINSLPSWVEVVEMDDSHMDFTLFVNKLQNVFHKSLRHE